MDTTLVINPGSASKKYAVYREGIEILQVDFEHHGEGFGRCVEIDNVRKRCDEIKVITYNEALSEVLEIAKNEHIITKSSDITKIGIRVVAPGTFFTGHRTINFEYIKKLKEQAHIAPLHIPPILTELEQVEKFLPEIRILGISDSAFHGSLPIAAKWYALPKKITQEKDLYRFGYHGLSVASVIRQIGNETGSLPPRIIVCHVGSGVSVTAVHKGKSIDTTMGFGPTSGLMMGTRGGGVDPSALIQLMRDGMNAEELEKMVSENGGLKGILGVGDLRIVLDRRKRGDTNAEIAFEMFTRAIRKAIGSMTAILGGLDMLILTGTAAERNPFVRKHITSNFKYLGLEIDDSKNETLGERAGSLSSSSSMVMVKVVHNDEMSEIEKIARVL